MQLGGLLFCSANIDEQDPEFFRDARLGYESALQLPGRLGWTLFEKTKLFLDLVNSQVILAEDIKTLKKKGHHLDRFIKAPLLSDHDLLEVDVMTSNGPLRCLLDTGSTGNLLHTDLFNELSMEEWLSNPDNRVKFSSFQIQGKEFGPLQFQRLPIKLPFKVEAILGMDFFLNHQVLFDFANQQIYFAQLEKKPQNQKTEIFAESYYIPVPVDFNSAKIPYFNNVEIGNQKMRAELNLSFYWDASVTKEYLQQIPDKVFIGTKWPYGWTGKRYRQKVYKTPQIKIENWSIDSICLNEEDPQFFIDAQMGEGEKEEIPGKLGWKLFKNTKLLLDLKNSKVVFCNDLETLKNQGHCLDRFIQAPLLLDDHSPPQVDVMTSTGPLRCFLSTGTTLNVLPVGNPNHLPVQELLSSSDHLIKMSIFQIQGTDFGPISFHGLPMQFPFKVDAILGMEFFLEHQVLIDFPNQQIYFAKAKKETLTAVK